MIPSFTTTLQAHLGHQLHNTLDHLMLGLALCALLLVLGVPYARALLYVTLFSLTREFFWQYPLRDAFALKFWDRLLDSAEFVLGAATAAWLNGPTLLARIEEALAHIGDVLVRAGLWLLSRIGRIPGVLGVPASPASR